MGKLTVLITAVLLFGFLAPAHSKSPGNYKSYKQITDKEVLIETTNGSYVLVAAYDHYALKISSVSPEEVLTLTSPRNTTQNSILKGSIYVEELDELMQITSSVNDGVVIKINKNPLHFSYIDKTNNQVIFKETKGVNFKNNEDQLIFEIEENEKIKLVTYSNLTNKAIDFSHGEIYSTEYIQNILSPNNEICLVSEKGYAVVFDSSSPYEIDFSKSEKIKVSKVEKDSEEFNYLFICGPQKPELIDRYAFHITSEDKQVSLK